MVNVLTLLSEPPMPRVNRSQQNTEIETSATPAPVKPATAKKLKAAYAVAIKKRDLTWGHAPTGIRFVRVPLKQGRNDDYSYTALVPVGALSPRAELKNPNDAKAFFIERSGGFAGITQVSGPFNMNGRKVDPQTFFAKFLENQRPPTNIGTEKYPSDNEDNGGGIGGDDMMVTMKHPSDNEDGGGVDGGIGAVTQKYPSDNEDGGGSIDNGGSISTEKYPSDNEDGGGGGSIGAVTEKYPSDNEDGGGGSSIGVTEKYPSDNEDGR